MLWRRLLVSVLVWAFVGAELPARPAGVAVFGVVTQSSGAHVGGVKLTSGSTIYDGDSLSTGNSGGINFRGTASRLYLPSESGVTLHTSPSGDLADLTVGTLVFSAARSSAIRIVALDAQISPAADVPTVAQISIAGPKLLQIFARRGALQFSYHGESAPIAEGASLRVVLDPSDDALAQQTTPPFSDQNPHHSGKRRLGFLFLVFGVPATITTIAVVKALESPDRP